ncbi:MAG TPA: hypothetical protein VMU39_08620 [Solirubrobacteraceae bacterium]|nr:hypothetical protein [Solirubrobacteraceae bacterium]
MNGPLGELVAAAPRWRRPGMRLLLALARRPRGLALLARVSPADQVAHGLLALGRYDDPARAATLGWDAEAVTARGQALREAEGRP